MTDGLRVLSCDACSSAGLGDTSADAVQAANLATGLLRPCRCRWWITCLRRSVEPARWRKGVAPAPLPTSGCPSNGKGRGQGERLYVPASAVVGAPKYSGNGGESRGLPCYARSGSAAEGDQVEVLSGVSFGDRWRWTRKLLRCADMTRRAKHGRFEARIAALFQSAQITRCWRWSPCFWAFCGAGHAARGGTDQRHHGQRADCRFRALRYDVEQMVATPDEQVLNRLPAWVCDVRVASLAWRC
jgi:hypothetical protein